MDAEKPKQPAVCPVCMGEGKLWCAMCGTWGNHRSGGCPELVGVGAAADDSRKPSSADETAFAVQRVVRELAETWERRIRARNCISWSERDAGKGEQLQECLNELRAEMAKLPNVGTEVETPRQPRQRPEL